MHHALLYISLPTLHEHKKTTFFFFSWTLMQFFGIELQKHFSSIQWRIKGDGISAIKFEAAQIHFLSDIFVTVAVVDAKAP